MFIFQGHNEVHDLSGIIQLVTDQAGPGTPPQGSCPHPPKVFSALVGSGAEHLRSGPDLLARASTWLASPWPSLPASPANSKFLCLGRSYDEKVDVFSFGIVLCEVGPGVGSSWHQVWWLLSTPYHPRLQVREAPGNWAAHSNLHPGLV